jgi:hypothetical protein
MAAGRTPSGSESSHSVRLRESFRCASLMAESSILHVVSVDFNYGIKENLGNVLETRCLK